jgi:uncharacterized protein (UPF0335 family)
MSEQGDNSGIAGKRLKSLLERIERIQEERKALASDIKDIFDEAKSAGFDVKIMRQVLARRKRDAAEVEEEDTMRDQYERVLSLL